MLSYMMLKLDLALECSLFVDNDNVLNGASQDLVGKLGMATEPLTKSYRVAWINGEKITVSSKCRLEFLFGRTCKEVVWCDILPMIVDQILLGRPWLFNCQVKHDGGANKYALWKDGGKWCFDLCRRSFLCPSLL